MQYPRHRNLRLLFTCLLLTGILAAQSAVSDDALRVLDDDNNPVLLQQPAQRIISLAPSMTELLFSLDVGDRIVGVMAFSDFPPQARDLPVVGRHDMLDMERIIALQPDLVIAWRSGNPRSAVQRLRELGLNVYVAEPESLASISTQLEKIGVLTGRQTEAAELATRFRRQLDDLAGRYQDLQPVTVFYQVWNSPMISVGGAELINDMISLCGGINIFSELPVGPKVSLEDVLVRNPDVIIASGSTPDSPAWLLDWLQWPQLSAVTNQHLYAIPPDFVQRHSLRALQGVHAMCEHIDKARI